MEPTILKRKTLWPERNANALLQALGIVALCVLFYIGLPLMIGLINERVGTARLQWAAPLAWTPIGVALVMAAVLIKRWQRKRPTRTTAEVEESPVELQAWASSVLDKKHNQAQLQVAENVTAVPHVLQVVFPSPLLMKERCPATPMPQCPDTHHSLPTEVLRAGPRSLVELELPLAV